MQAAEEVGIGEGLDEAERALLLGLLHFNQDEIDLAIPCLTRAIELDPEYKQTYLIRGICRLKQGSVKEAEADFAAFLGERKEDVEHYNCIGKLLYACGCLEESEPYFRKALQYDPGQVAVLSNLGSVLVELDRLSEAKACFTKAIHLDPGFSEVHVNLGMLYFIVKDFQSAESCFLKALDLNEAQGVYDPLVYANLGDLYLTLGDLESSVEAYSIALSLDGDLPSVRTRMGMAYRAQGQLAAAKEQFEVSILSGKAPAQAHEYLAEMLRDEGRVFEALSEFRIAIRKSNCRDPEPMVSLAEMLLRMERYSQAFDLFQRAFGLGDRTPSLLAVLSRLAEHQGREHEAVIFFRLLDGEEEKGPSALLEVARRCAESPIPEIRNPRRALAITRNLQHFLAEKHAGVYAVMASAYAGMGDFRQAAEAQHEAIKALPTGNPLMVSFEKRLNEYRNQSE